MWVVPEVKQTTSNFNTVLKYSAICVLVTLAILFLRKNGFDAGTSESFSCDEVGYFPDPINNMNCYRSYVLCISGENWKSYSCPLGTRFSALDGRCMADQMQNSGNHECGSGSAGGSEMIELFSDKYTAEFNCPSAGVFSNEYSVTCEDYILCVNTMQSDLYAIYLHCGDDQFYSHEHSACIDKGSNYCDKFGQLHLINHPPTRPIITVTPSPSPLEQTTTTSTTALTTTVVADIETTSTAVITTTTTHLPTIASNSAPTTEEMVPISTNCDHSEDLAENVDSSFSEEVEIIGYPPRIPDALFMCTSSGRFETPVLVADGPKFYILCTMDSYSDRLKGYLFQCPEDTRFSTEDNRCVRPTLQSSTDTGVPQETTTTPSMLFEEDTTLPTTATTEVFPSPSTTTTALVAEIITTTTPPIITTTTTPIPIVTSPTEGMLSTTPEVLMATTTEATHGALSTALECSSSGRHHNQYTLNCRSYLLCVENGAGEFIGSYFQCPKDTRFSDSLQRCVKDYDCPYFHCTSPGVFPYVRDKDRYVLCVSNGERLVAYKMKCPPDTIFSNILRRCLSERFKNLRAW